MAKVPRSSNHDFREAPTRTRPLPEELRGSALPERAPEPSPPRLDSEIGALRVRRTVSGIVPGAEALSAASRRKHTEAPPPSEEPSEGVAPKDRSGMRHAITEDDLDRFVRRETQDTIPAPPEASDDDDEG